MMSYRRKPKGMSKNCKRLVRQLQGLSKNEELFVQKSQGLSKNYKLLAQNSKGLEKNDVLLQWKFTRSKKFMISDNDEFHKVRMVQLKMISY